VQAGASVSLVVRSAARAQLETSQKAIAATKKASANTAAAAGLAALSAAVAAAAEASDAPFCVVDATLGSDSKALKKALDALASHGQAALALSVDPESGKLLCVAFVPPHLTGLLAANEWVAAALEPCGGRGGGKADAAQGQAASGERVRLSIAFELCMLAFSLIFSCQHAHARVVAAAFFRWPPLARPPPRLRAPK
jgi:alanyl-tRNA synthetase